EDDHKTDAHGKMPKPVFRSLVFILVSVFLWFMGYNAVTSAFSRYAMQELQGNFAMVLMVCTAAAIVSYIQVGIIAGKLGRKRTILIGIILLATAFFSGIFFYRVTPLLYLFFALAGIGWAFINVNSYPMVVELSRESDVGKYTGYYYTVSMTAQVITPVVSGFLMGHVGYRTLFLTMLFVKHGDTKPTAKKGLEALDVDD
ncbi:MAG: MFS transporter, partial [Ruthenibacterium sp.]